MLTNQTNFTFKKWLIFPTKYQKGVGLFNIKNNSLAIEIAEDYSSTIDYKANNDYSLTVSFKQLSDLDIYDSEYEFYKKTKKYSVNAYGKNRLLNKSTLNEITCPLISSNSYYQGSNYYVVDGIIQLSGTNFEVPLSSNNEEDSCRYNIYPGNIIHGYFKCLGSRRA